jgi:hypothetical protein
LAAFPAKLAGRKRNPAAFMAPWTVEEGANTYVVRSANGFLISVTYWDDEPRRDFNLRKNEARRVALAISRLPELLGKDKGEV